MGRQIVHFHLKGAAVLLTLRTTVVEVSTDEGSFTTRTFIAIRLFLVLNEDKCHIGICIGLVLTRLFLERVLVSICFEQILN